jgi:hypothetical protein
LAGLGGIAGKSESDIHELLGPTVDWAFIGAAAGRFLKTGGGTPFGHSRGFGRPGSGPTDIQSVAPVATALPGGNESHNSRYGPTPGFLSGILRATDLADFPLTRKAIGRPPSGRYHRAMSWESHIFKREELYDQVWSTPMRQLAKEFQLSDSGLAKICRKLNIPRPGRGYWMKKQAGRKVNPTPLPPAKPGAPTQHRVSRWHDPAADLGFGEEAVALLERENDPSMAIAVPEVLDHPHKWVRKSAGWLKRNSRTQAELRKERACLDITASRAALDRALRIADTLLKALEARGFEVEVTEPVPYAPGRYGGPPSGRPSRTGVHILGEFVEFAIEEGVNIIEAEQKPVRYNSGYSYTPRPEYVHEPNGKLALKLHRQLRGITRQTWADGKRQRVESCLGSFITTIIQGSERERLYQLDQERIQREHEEEQRRQEEAARLRAIEQARIADLNQRVGDWDRAGRIYDFLEECEAAARARGVNVSPQSDLGKWIVWARGFASQLREAALEVGPTDQV